VDTDNTPPDPDDDHGAAEAHAEEDNSTELLAFLSKQKGSTFPGHLANVLSTSKTKNAKGVKFMSKPNASHAPPPKDEEIVVNGKQYHQVHAHCILYSVSSHKSHKTGSLVDRGSNDGIAGNDVHIIEKSDQMVDVCGIDNHQITNIPIVTTRGVVTTQHGPIVTILHQYAYTGQGKTIHSSSQLEWYKNDVNNKSIKVSGGMQCIRTNNGYVIPISIRDGLPYIAVCPFSDEEWDNLPHVVLTSDMDWDPGVLDQDLERIMRLGLTPLQIYHPISPPLPLMMLVTILKGLLSKVMMSCTVGIPPSTLVMHVSCCILTRLILLELPAVLLDLMMLSIQKWRISPACTNLMPMRSPSILLTISHSDLCLDGFLLI